MRPTTGSCPSETLRYNASAGEVLASSSLQRHYQLLLCSTLRDHLACKSCIALC